MNRSLLISGNMAFAFGIFLPLMETIRRWKQLTDPDYFLAWFDDYLMGGSLLLAAWLVSKHKEKASEWLAGVWGIAVGGCFLSTLGQLEYIKQDQTDPAPVSSEIVLAIKGFFLLLSLIGMTLCFKRIKGLGLTCASISSQSIQRMRLW